MKIQQVDIRLRAFLTMVLFLLAGLTFVACDKGDEPEPDNGDKALNGEFLNLMKDWYFWYDQIPDIDPMNYPTPVEVLEAIRYRPLDRWSYITTWKEFESYYLESKMIGYGFGSGFDASGKLRVLFVYRTTKMYEEGVRRSWIIEAVNGTQITAGMNINQMLGDNEVGVSNSFRFRKPDGTTVDLTVAKEELVMNTVLHYEVKEVNGSKVGYLVLQGFTTPTMKELEEVFDLFVQAGIEELILDLRYNGGGQTNVANFLSSMIGGNQVDGQIFTRYMFNDKQPQANRADTFQLVTRKLNLDRLLTIGTRNTASASEMVINGLRPYMPVVIFGTATYGKPMGMTVYKDDGDRYAFVPVTFKTANADGQGDFFDGIPVDAPAPDGIDRMFGDPLEESLKAALYYIETGSFLDAPVAKVEFVQPRDRMRGLREIIGAH